MPVPKPYAPALAFVMTPVALTAYVLAAWRLGADLNWFSEFFVERGLLSRWQVWLALAAAAQVTAHRLKRGMEDTNAPAGS
jgi:hypothetical protein